jgi:glycosyltransferase involved in cell wall biosynthesis
MKKFKVINQFTPSVAFGDSVSNALLYTQRLLQKMGYKSNIYIGSIRVDINFKNDVYHISEYEENEEQLLLYHFSIGHEYHDEILKFKDKKVIIYHNITPDFYFKKDKFLEELCKLGRKQLSTSSSYFIGSIADSTYNCKELLYYDYKNPKVLPVLVDFEKIENIKPSKKIIKKFSKYFNILFVGRIVPHKAQLNLIDTIFQLKKQGTKKFRLHIVGSVGDEDYMNTLKDYVKFLGLKKQVNFTGKVSSKELNAYYKVSNLYLSLSNHEGFGMPLIEAMRYNIPVLAFNAGGTQTTIPKICLLDKKASSFVSQTILRLIEDNKYLDEMITQQEEYLKKFFCENIYNQLEQYINMLEEREF